MTKVMIGVNTYPGHAYCRKEFVDNLKKMAEHHGNAEIVICWNGKKKAWGFKGLQLVNYQVPPGQIPIVTLREKSNLLRKWFLKGDYTHFMMVESDVIPPVNALTTMIERDKDIVNGLYFIRTQEYRLLDLKAIADNHTNQDPEWKGIKGALAKGAEKAIIIRQKQIPTVWLIKESQARLAQLEDFFPIGGLKRVFGSGMGCNLSTREVIEAIPYSIAVGNSNKFTDFCFHRDAFLHGFEAFVDCDVWCGHQHLDLDDAVFRKWFDVDTLDEVKGMQENEY